VADVCMVTWSGTVTVPGVLPVSAGMTTLPVHAAVHPGGEVTTGNYLNSLAAVVEFGIDDPSCAIPLSPSSK
jgi:hypothetical protein